MKDYIKSIYLADDYSSGMRFNLQNLFIKQKIINFKFFFIRGSFILEFLGMLRLESHTNLALGLNRLLKYNLFYKLFLSYYIVVVVVFR